MTTKQRWLTGLASVLALTMGSAEPAQADGPLHDVVILGGTVVDGTGAPGYRADVAIKGDRIVAISRDGLAPESGRYALNAEGLVVAPGFIDNHAHISTNIDQYPLAENFLRQGITSIVASLHSGAQPYPLKPYAESLRVAPNVAFFTGHSYARMQVLGMENRAPNADELRRMQNIIADGMKDGALGLSTGLIYVPANYARTEEVIALAKVAACHGGIYVSHIRDEGNGVLDSIKEAIRIAREAGLPGQINHHKVMGAGQWGWSRQTIALIDEARASGLDITHDVYPYAASASYSTVMFPSWALAGGPDAFRKRVEEKGTRARLEQEMMRILMVQRTGADLKRLQFRSVEAFPDYDGRTLADLAADRGLAGTPEDAIQLLIELQLKGGFTAIYHAMDEADIIRILQHPLAMIETDGDPVGLGEGFPHPRSYGAFPRVLGRYVREQGVITLEDAVRRMTSLAADQIGQTERGRVREGAYADITVFDPRQIADKATYIEPHQYPVGIVHVLVNGVPVIRGGALTGEKPGRPLLGPARPGAVRADKAVPGCEGS
ncbi:D-aminoacylase [Sphingobium sp. SYK-6]|uniref:N-acyl-D-amino-acid deacylase family protein n=1 Tax=Sphingobium sp. (strain NBRC 103272 / SYK-6) TaxID=627192 RepID=UPI000227754F|nr:D-aminoacylase [Sphingobium sp. SYK-6]BAK66099.1 D-aminoacylase [Sphingobium sp. SYK-6]